MKINKENLFFTSDLHFSHSAIIEYCSRPFKDVNEMNAKLIENFNKTVPKNGETFILGDIGMISRTEAIQSLLSLLNGKKHLILGNHDYQNKIDRLVARELFESVHDLLDLKVLDDEIEGGRLRLFLSHYPMNAWAGSGSGSCHLFGHIHSKPYSYDSQYNPRTLDVGVDAHNYCPISYQRVKELITKQCLYKEKRNGLTEEELNKFIQ